jgi:membrane associated rhomboid family serine protease
MNYYRRNNFLSELPPVTRGLLVANVIVFVISMLAPRLLGIDLTRYLALFNFQSEFFSPSQLVTHMFMHGSLGHIFFNMFGLYLFGRVLENVLGGKKFFILYIVSGLAAAFLQLGVNQLQINSLMQAAMELRSVPSPEVFWELAQKYNFDTAPEVSRLAQNWINFPDNQNYAQQAFVMCERMVHTIKSVPMVGASGAVLGILAAFAVMFPNVELMIIFLPIPIKAKYLVPFYAVAELFLGVANFSFDNIAHFAHLGGALAGFILVMYWKKNQFRDKLL